MAKFLTYFGTDGLLHILCSLILTAIIAAFLPIWAAVIITIVIGIGKELIWDLWLKKGSAQWKDIIADVIGIILAIIITVVIMYV